MRSQINAVDWNSNIERIRGLWPNANWTPEERDLWYQNLKDLNQDWVREAIDEVAKSYSSNKPTLKWVLSAFKQVKVSRTDPTGQAVEEAAESRWEEEEMAARSRVEMQDAIARFTPEEVANAKYQVFSRFKIKVPDSDTESWSRMSLGLVHAALTGGAE